MKKFNAGVYTIEELNNGDFYYEHRKHGDEKAGCITIDSGEVSALDGDYDIPLIVLAVLFAEHFLTVEGFKQQMEGRYK